MGRGSKPACRASLRQPATRKDASFCRGTGPCKCRNHRDQRYIRHARREAATTTIPIVIKSSGDAVLLGLVATLARPGGNVTGFSIAGPEIFAKELSLLNFLSDSPRSLN